MGTVHNYGVMESIFSNFFLVCFQAGIEGMDRHMTIIIKVSYLEDTTMTQNQISYYAAKNQERGLAENERHNQVTESLTQQQVDIQRQYNSILDSYYTRSNDLKERQMQLQYDIDSKKLTNELEIASRKAELEAEAIQIDKWYKQAMADNETRKRENEQASLDETNRHNESMELLEKYRQDIENRKVYNQQFQWDVEYNWNVIKWNQEFGFTKDKFSQEMNARMLQLTNEYDLGLKRISLDVRKNNILAAETDAKILNWERQYELGKSEQGQRWTSTFLPFLLPTANGALGAAVDFMK